MPAPERCVPCGTEHVHTALHLNLLSGVELSTAGQAMKKGERSRGDMEVITGVEMKSWQKFYVKKKQYNFSTELNLLVF